MKEKPPGNRKPWHIKPAFGCLYTMKGSKYIYISVNYYKQRIRFPTDLEDTPKNWDTLCNFLADVGQKIRNRTFNLPKTFYWLDEQTKAHFAALEGNDYKPAPEHVLFGEYAAEWMKRKIPNFTSVTKQRSYAEALNSRIIPYFQKMTFASITASNIEEFIDSLKRCKGPNKALSVKRIKNIIGPLSRVWAAACSDHSWNMHNPFSDIAAKYKELEDRALAEKERQVILMLDDDDESTSTRDIFLLKEWQRLMLAVDPHYHPVMELLLMGLIGTELEGLMKRHLKDDVLQVRSAVVREKGGKMYLKFKPKNWYRKRSLQLTARLKQLLERAAAVSTSTQIIRFEGDIELPAHEFLLTMKDGSPFNYASFREYVWKKALKQAGLDSRVPYAARHTLVQWALLIGTHKNRLVDMMGHSTKKMIDEVYGQYRKGLVDERQQILDYLGDDFLALEELRTAFPERYRQKMTLPVLPVIPTRKAAAPALAVTFCQSFGQSQGLYADNYLK